jgi:hypothetical protein
LGDTEGVPDHLWLLGVRRLEVALGLLLTAVSFAPWWTRRANGSGASVWTGPHFSWLAVLLCLAVVAGRLLAPGLGPFDIAWGYPVGVCLMGLLLATFALRARILR